MSQLKLIALVACLSLLTVESASANPWGYHHHGYYGYRPGFYGYGYGPVVVPPPPVVVAPPYPVAPPAYYAPPPVYAPPVVAPVYAPPAYGPPAYTYGAVGPRGFGFGYASPGFGVYLGR